MDLSQDTLTEIVYDLNIYQLELENEDGTFEHQGPWYIHVYEYDGRTVEEVTDPIELTQDEYDSLIAPDEYFSELDVWYGLEGFVQDKIDNISQRLLGVFECLPKYKEEVLF
jgi:hypothetical protein